MDAEQAELLQTSPLIQRLDRRRTHPIGVIDLRRYSSESSGLPNWLVQRSTLVEQLQSRYSSREQAAGTELPLAIASPVPVAERVSDAPAAPSAVAIAPSTPVETSPPVQVSQTAPLVAASAVENPDWSSPVPPPEMIASLSETVIEPTAAPPAEQYRIRRVSANPATQPAAIQRKAASDESSAAIASSSMVSAVSIAPELPTYSATVDDRPQPSADPAPLGLVAQAAASAPISAIPSQSRESATEATLLLRHALPEQPDAPHLESTVAIVPETAPPTQQTRVEGLIARPLLQSASMPEIAQRAVNPVNLQPTVTEFSTQPAAIAPALSISALPVQPSLIWRSADAATHGLQRRSQPELPLAVSSIPSLQPAIARQTDTTPTAAIATPESSPSSSIPTPPVFVPTATGGVNVGQIAEQVSRILFRQLTVERERRGMGKWF